MLRPAYLLVVLASGLVSATTELDDLMTEDGEGRTIFTSGGTYYLALNTTFLIYYTLLAGNDSLLSNNSTLAYTFTGLFF